MSDYLKENAQIGYQAAITHLSQPYSFILEYLEWSSARSGKLLEQKPPTESALFDFYRKRRRRYIGDAVKDAALVAAGVGAGYLLATASKRKKGGGSLVDLIH